MPKTKISTLLRMWYVQDDSLQADPLLSCPAHRLVDHPGVVVEAPRQAQVEADHLRLTGNGRRNMGGGVGALEEWSRQKRLPDEAPPVGKIILFSKIAVTFEPIQRL